MSWIFFALLAPAISTIVNFLDKYVVSNKIKDYKGMVIFSAFIGIIFGTFFWFITGFPILSIQDTIIILVSGILNIWSAALYFKAISLDEASKIIILFQTSPVMVLVLSLLFLNERISTLQVIGFFVILAAAIGISIEKDKTSLKLSKTFWLIMAVNFIWAVAAIMAKFVIGATAFSSILAYESWGIGLGGILLFLAFPQIRNSFMKSIRTVSKSTLLVLCINECFYVLAKAITFFAFSIGPASLISVLGSTQVIFGIMYGLVLTIFLPKYFKEDLRKETLLKKFLFAGLMLIGIYLVGK